MVHEAVDFTISTKFTISVPLPSQMSASSSWYFAWIHDGVRNREILDMKQFPWNFDRLLCYALSFIGMDIPISVRSGVRFTRQEFGLISGLYCGEQPTTRPAPSTRISDTYFGGSKKKLSSIVQKLSHLKDKMTGLRGQVTQLDTKVFLIEDRLSYIEDMITRVETKVDDDSQRPHNSDREQLDLDDVHGAYDDDGHKANFDDAMGYATNDQYMDMRWDSFKSNEMTYDFGDDMVEYLMGVRPSLSKAWAYYDRILLPLNKDNKHWLLGVINLKSRHVQLYDPKKWGYTADFHINYFEPRICQMLPYLLRHVQFFKVQTDISNSLKPFKISLAPDISPKVKPDDMFRITFNLGHVARRFAEISGSIMVEISCLSRANMSPM
ncbi:hypothetical protein FNV43_RR09599 [Rhamnella rubrinervis]|uniref:Ubiquitin-like protease family profile domain-containing protein n=1 Tax=Rhamnella rubrinervis TaxID=2594499 RepID=A0A8K0MKD1_9ROSA|nr:hypothetical protein FNV43_RR09599 [Rhamnella rubrinervis]